MTQKRKKREYINVSSLQINIYKKKFRTLKYYLFKRDMFMNLNVTRRRFSLKKKNNNQRISQEQRKKRFKKNLYLYCKKLEYRAKKCKTKQQFSTIKKTLITIDFYQTL